MKTTLFAALAAALLTLGLGSAFVVTGLPDGAAAPVYVVGGGGFLQSALPPASIAGAARPVAGPDAASVTR